MNILTNAHVHSVRQAGPSAVEFHIDLRQPIHALLRDPQVLQGAMDEYAAAYPSVKHWEAEASGGLLIITVTGTLSGDPIEEY